MLAGRLRRAQRIEGLTAIRRELLEHSGGLRGHHRDRTVERPDDERRQRESIARASLLLQESLGVDAGLLEDGAQGALGHVAGVIGDGGVPVECRIEPDLVRTCGLAVELQAELLQPGDDVPIAKARQRAHQVPMISG